MISYDWLSRMKMKAGVKVKPLPAVAPPLGKAVASAAVKQAIRGNKIVARRL